MRTPPNFSWYDDLRSPSLLSVLQSLPQSAPLGYLPYPDLLRLSSVCRQLNEVVEDYILHVLFPDLIITLSTTISDYGEDETEREHLYPIDPPNRRDLMASSQNWVIFEPRCSEGRSEGLHYVETRNTYSPCEAGLLLPEEARPHVLRLRPKGETKASLVITQNGYIESIHSPRNYRFHHLYYSNRPMTIYYKVDAITSAHILDAVVITLPFLKQWICKRSLEL